MVLDGDGVAGELEHVRVVDAEPLALRPRHGNIARTATAACIDHAHLLAPEGAAEDDTTALPESRLVDVEFVGVDRALHNVLTQPVDAGDEYDIAKT